ncbi:hypothetical protein GH714_009067 [Hevea brasiliensis]|uniref:Myb/SANT-like domain-containing protein n=1 Tax=Hevea brasiliensis TaxID=3981 RepID=A0A6A6LWU9_HEVBR|nr:hypothetical protein GH714_009067 [Hevea brasiliensis]
MATKNKGAGRVAWSSEQFNLFVKICVRGTNLGKRNGGGWGDKGYTWLQNELRQVGVEYTKEQLRHKWDWMKDQWKMWKALKGNETGLGWDPIKGTVVAPDEWWNEKIKTTTYAVDIICSYYLSYIHKEPCMDSFHTGLVWLQEIMRGNERRCVNLFRMDKDTLIKLCLDLECHYKLKCSKKMTILEKVGMFLYVLALGASNRQVQERFQHSGETVSRNFHEVLKAMLCLSIDMIKPTDPTFSNIPPEILNDDRYMPHFKDCIGAIDGTHVSACVQEENLIRFIGRKGVPTQNIMAACSFDMQFTFYAINKQNLNFPKPPPGKYYVVDAGYQQMEGYLAPYKGTRYHLPDFQRGGRPRGLKEIFNRWHSSLRCCIERTFGVWKARWKILRTMPPYSFYVQRDIVVVSMALHNYIRRKALADPAFERLDKSPNFVPPDIFRDVDDIQAEESSQESGALQMNALRDQIACSLMLANNDY